MVPEIWNMTDKIICHFKLFFDLYPTNNMKNQNFEKNGKKKKTTKKTHTHTPGNTIILHKCTKNHDHMSYCS